MIPNNPLAPLLALLRAAHLSHWTTHWTVEGTAFFADHQLFDQLYNALPGEIDTLAEKSVFLLGADVVDLKEQLALMLECSQYWLTERNLYTRALLVENDIQEAIKAAKKTLADNNMLSLGLDNFLAQMADDHEKAKYLLGQRLKQEKVASMAQRIASRWVKD